MIRLVALCNSHSHRLETIGLGLKLQLILRIYSNPGVSIYNIWINRIHNWETLIKRSRAKSDRKGLGLELGLG